MNIDTIRIFCDVVLHQSFSRGALVNDVSQSAATQSIHRLEHHLGVRLVDRSRRPFILTSEGQICYDGFRAILESYDTVVSTVQTPLNDKESGSVRVGAIYSAGLHGMAQVMCEFIKTCPKAKIKLELMRSKNIYQAIMTSSIDLGVVAYPIIGPDVVVVPLGAETMIYVCSPDSELVGLTTISLDQLHETNFVTFEREMIIRKEIDRQLRQRLVSVNITAEYENIETIKYAVEVGLGGAILPANTVRNEIQLGKLIGIPITSPKIAYPLGIVYKQSKILTPTMTKFISVMLESPWDNLDKS